MAGAEHIAGHTVHRRHGGPRNAFRYRVDYVLLDAESGGPMPPLARNRAGPVSLFDRDHGGDPGSGRGAAWVREVLAAERLALPGPILLLTQPRVLGQVFNPVSFWLLHDAGGVLRAAIAEVTNTFGDRHSYLCRHPDLRPIAGDETLTAAKAMHVSPFQPVAGEYAFRFSVRPEAISILIDYRDGADGGVVATLSGRRRPLTRRAMAGMVLRMGSRRVVALIHLQALKLWWKGALYRARPRPPIEALSRSRGLTEPRGAPTR